MLSTIRSGWLLTLLAWSVAACRPTLPVPPTAAVATYAPTTAVAEELYLPVAGRADSTPTATATPLASPAPAVSPTLAPTPTPAYPAYEGPPLRRSQLGVQIHLHNEDIDLVFDHLRALGAGWVKVQVSWKLHEPAPGRYDEYLFGELDRLVTEAAANNVAVMIGVAKAPEWSRPTTEMDGPPTDYALFQDFTSYLAGRYQGQVAAYELWNESNLRREWNGVPLRATDFVALMRAGAAGVRATDPQAIVISGAPAPTGINDGLEAVDDRVYFQGMVVAGVADVVDAIGVHPYGWANPPEARASAPEATVPTHHNHASFFFHDTLRDYRAILEEAGRPDRRLWVTEFGWGSFEGMNALPPDGAEFMAHVNEWQQAEYTLRAYEMAQDWDWVGPLILWNLNFAPTFGPAFSESGYSLLRPDGTPRPVYRALQSIPKRLP